MAEAAVHSYSTVFTWAAGIFVLGAIVGGLLLRPGAAAAPDQQPAPAIRG